MNIFIIARVTLKEAFRKKIIMVGILLTCLFLVLYWAGVHFAFDSLRDNAKYFNTSTNPNGGRVFLILQASMFLVLGLFAANLIAGLAAVFTAIGTVSTEAEQGTLQTVAARPIKRSHIILGKWLGHAAMLTVYLGSLFLFLNVIIYAETGFRPGNVWPATAVFVLEALTVLTLALFGSTFLSSTVNAVIVLMLYVIALIGGFMEQVGVMVGRESLFNTGVFSSLIMPSDSLYRYVVYLIKPTERAIVPDLAYNANPLGPFDSLASPSVYVPLYAVIFIFAFLFGAIIVFQRRDL